MSKPMDDAVSVNSEQRFATPFVDTPVLAAKRVAFDSPTQVNLDALIEAVRSEASQSVDALVQRWREKASRYVRGESSASEFGRCETWSNCADELSALASRAAQGETPDDTHGPFCGCDCACGRGNGPAQGETPPQEPWREGREAGLRDALEAVTGEHLEEPQDEVDAAYDRAIIDARQAIGRLFHAAPAEPPARAAAPQEISRRVMHARKQGAADGFQQGWRAALSRIKQGDVVADLLALIPHGPRLPIGVTDAISACTARIYPDVDYERYLDEIVGSTVGVIEELNDEHAAACIRQLTEALHALRRSRDELRADAVRVALEIRESNAPQESPTPAAKGTEDCEPRPWNSRICERGTGGCMVRHTPAAGAQE